MSQTSSSISAHMDGNVPDVVIRTPRPVLHTADVTLPSAEPANRSREVEFRIFDDDADRKIPACFRSFIGSPGLDQDNDEPDVQVFASARGTKERCLLGVASDSIQLEDGAYGGAIRDG